MNAGAGEPIIEIDGQLQFGLPGQPIFPALTNETILKPTLDIHNPGTQHVADNLNLQDWL